MPRAAPWRPADLIAFFLPMHTATRLFLRLVDRVRAVNPRAHLCAYGLYAPLNERLLRGAGVGTDAGRRIRSGLCGAGAPPAGGEAAAARPRAAGLDRAASSSWCPTAGTAPAGRLRAARRPGRHRAGSATPRRRAAASTCAATARWSPCTAACSASCSRTSCWRTSAARWPPAPQHITFGDPDFFNGPGHAIPIVEALHREWPWLTYDVTIKVEHLLKHRDLLPVAAADRLRVRHQRRGIAR